MGDKNDPPSSTTEPTAEAMRRTIEDLRKKEDRAKTLIENLRKDLSYTQTCLDTIETENATLREQVGNAKTLLASKTTDIETSTEKVSKMQALLNSKIADIETLREQVGNAKTLLASKTTDIETLTEKLSTTQTLLNSKIADIEVWKNKLEKLSKSKHRLAIKEAKGRMMERFDVVAEKFQASLPYFVAFLGVLFAVKLTCETRAFFLCLVGCSILGIFLIAIIGVFRTWKIFRSFNSKRKILRLMITDIGGQEGSDGHHSNSDLEGAEQEEWKAIMYKQWWSFAWPTIAYISILVLYSWVCNIGVGMYIFNEGCVNDSPAESPAHSPLASAGFSSMDYIAEFMEDWGTVT